MKLCLQMHDEGLSNIFVWNKEICEKHVNNAVEEVNQEVKLNVTIGCSIQFGERYSDCH